MFLNFNAELENNLIDQIISFQYIICLPTSRWVATKKAMITVPVTPEAVLNTVKQIPRTPTEAGIIPVKLKRKLEYEGSHKTELIDINKVHRTLEYLKDSGHPDYQFSRMKLNMKRGARNKMRVAMDYFLMEVRKLVKRKKKKTLVQ